MTQNNQIAQCLWSQVKSSIEDLKPCISSDEILRAYMPIIFQRAMERAEAIHVPMVIAIANREGRIILQYEMPDALLIAAEMAPNKAYTAVAMRAKTGDLHDRVQPDNLCINLSLWYKGLLQL